MNVTMNNYNSYGAQANISAQENIQNQLTELVRAMPENVERPSQSVQRLVQEEQDRESQKQLEKELRELSKKLNDEMKQVGTSISFKYNDNLPGLTVTVKEMGGEKIIREIPSKEAIELMSRMREVVGMIFDKKA